MEPKNIFLIIFIVSFIFLILDFLIFKTHQQLEHFEDQKITIKKLNIEGEPAISPYSITPSESDVNKKNKKAKDISFLTDINSEDLTINDFYPTHPEDTTKSEEKKINNETLKLLEIQKDSMVKFLMKVPKLYYAKSHFPLEISQRAFDHLWRVCESYEMWCKETKQEKLITLRILN